MPLVEQTLTFAQADVAVRAYDLYFRVLSGQLDEIPDLVLKGYLRPRHGMPQPSHEDVERLRALMEEARRIIGFAPGQSHGAGRHVHPEANVAFEMELVTRKAVGDHRVPDPADRWTNVHDGLFMRYADGPAPEARVVEGGPGEPIRAPAAQSVDGAASTAPEKRSSSANSGQRDG